MSTGRFSSRVGARRVGTRRVSASRFGAGAAIALSSLAVIVSAFAACGDDASGENGTSSGGNNDGSADGNVAPQRAEFGLDSRPANPTCKAPARPPSSAAVKFERVFQTVNLGNPMMMAQRPGDGSRWYVAQRGGTVAYFPSDNPTALTNAANLSALANTAIGQTINTSGEGGFLGFAFHPKFAQNGRLYVTWTSNGGANGMRSVVGYLTSTNGGDTFTSYTNVLQFDQVNATNHKGGGIGFGKDGFLYLSFGDGGGGDDQFVKGQKRTEMFAKVLRIDVDNGSPYGIPDGNPFKAGGGEPTTFAYGFRNPFRFSLDRETGDLWVGDVGQNKWEEIDPRVKAGSNYGWPCKEGTHDYLDGNAEKCPANINMVDPIVEIEHVPANSRSITGGVVYRGKDIPEFVGNYVFGDFQKQELYTLETDPVTGQAKATLLDGAPAANWVHFAEDANGEVYAVALNQSSVYKMMREAPPTASTFPDRLSKTGCMDAADVKKPASGLVPFGVNSPLWSDGAEKDRWLALPDGQKITVNETGDFDLPKGSVLVKSFSVGGKLVETRLLVHHDDDVWAGYTYEWLDDQSDAVYLPSSKRKTVGTQTWYYPSRSDCVVCHTEAAGRSLGLELGQLNGDFVYASTNRISNQLKTLEHIGMFAAPLGKPVEQLPIFANPTGQDGSLEARARSYLHSNCSNCHRPEGGGAGEMDLRISQNLAGTKTCNVDGDRGDIGVAGAKLLVPGQPGKSLISLRPHALTGDRMPPLASSVVDNAGIAVVDQWITSVAACPPDGGAP